MGKNSYTYKLGYNGTLEERMEKKTQRDLPDKCWLWTGCLDTAGYGCIRVDGRLRRATHIAYELSYGQPMPPSKIIMHTCDNPSCVNPSHLILGNKMLNSQDMLLKGRGNKVAHEQHYKAKLTESQVQEIRALAKNIKINFTKVALQYGVNRTTISRIINHLTWR